MSAAEARIAHHDLCFGCGLANVFGLQLELEERPRGVLGGRFFVKQDHQGPPGVAHAGVLASALVEVMALVVDRREYAPATGVELELHREVPVGTYLHVEARLAGDGDGAKRAVAELRNPERVLVAEGRARFSEGQEAR
jgi:acyl-coenzyme A thioesterase PaaI-like protein